ncbi:MAG: glycosyltransferase [Alphaproteobacteria bacterium]
MIIAFEILASLTLMAWLYLWIFHGGFWRADQLLPPARPSPSIKSKVVAVIPARNEADVISKAISSVLSQDYPGLISVILVDDHSTDGTAEIAAQCARTHPHGAHLRIIKSKPLPSDWVGKMWAVNTGVHDAIRTDPDYLWLTDADIIHQPHVLGTLVKKAETHRMALVSLMVMLHCQGLWERLLIPAFVFFFQKLYPFPWINNPKSVISGAAGGCMLVRRTALEKAGGIEALQKEIIDDCALGRRLKQHGPIWLGLTRDSLSIRPYEGIGDIWKMVARSAFTQLRYSTVLLIGTLLGLGILYLAPPFLILSLPWHGQLLVAGLGALAWGIMMFIYRPTLRLYQQPFWCAVFLPLAGALYALMTLDSARQYWCGKGGQWKGRAQAQTSSS